MWWICASAVCVISFYRFSAFLLVIAVLTFYSTFVGVRVLRRKKLGTEKWYDWVVAILTILFGVGLCGYGISVFMKVSNFHWLGALSIGFGIFTASGAVRDIRFFVSRQPNERLWWLYQHINAMGGSYIAAITAFAVQNGGVFLPSQSWAWLLWVLPGVVGSQILSRVVANHRKKVSIPVRQS